MNINKLDKIKIGIIGIGYVGLPLAIEFGKYYKTFAYDISAKRITELNKNNDPSYQISKKEFKISSKLIFTNNSNDLDQCQIYKVECLLLILFFITLLPLVPTGNFFNNWISIVYFLPIGFLLSNINNN